MGSRDYGPISGLWPWSLTVRVVSLSSSPSIEVLGDHGWIDVDLELGKRWVGGTLRLVPGKEGTQAKDLPLEVFFRKIIGIRDRLRVLEQKLNSHPGLAPEEKLELQGYISRCYGSLTTFNVLFGAAESQFKGQGDREG